MAKGENHLPGTSYTFFTKSISGKRGGMIDYKKGMRNCGFWIFLVCSFALAGLLASPPDAGAYGDYSGCSASACHGDFRATSYVSKVDGQTWGNLHNIHRTNMLSSDCNTCHRSGTTSAPVNIGSSAGGTGLQAISCMGCHGRTQDAGHDSESAGLGAGLRQHHTRAGETVCQGCHSDANPANYTPVGENVKPPYYATPGTGHPNMPTDPCNANGKENFAGALIGLDNDGNDLYDMSDPACRKVPSRVDFDGDRKTDIAIYRPSTGGWFIVHSSDNTTQAMVYGISGDVPAPGDYDGDGKMDIAIYRPSNGAWFIMQSSTGTSRNPYAYGVSGDVAVPGDYDGDGKTDIAVYRPSTGGWFIARSSNGTTQSAVYGVSGDIPVPGDYDGDGKTDIAVYRPSTGGWFVIRSSNGTTQSAVYGVSSDIPVPGDYDGDGKTDIAVYRPSTGGWFVIRSSNGTTQSAVYGVVGDIPVQARY
jgi:hypothetical protein